MTEVGPSGRLDETYITEHVYFLHKLTFLVFRVNFIKFVTPLNEKEHYLLSSIPSKVRVMELGDLIPKQRDGQKLKGVSGIRLHPKQDFPRRES